jgi:hypothetical protein
MATNDGGKDDVLSRVLMWVVIGVAALFAVRIAMVVFGVAAFVLFKLGPILLVGWLVVLAIRYVTKKPPAKPDSV